MELVRTNDNCVGCNKCIRACRCVGANVSEYKDGKNRIVVDPDKCIGCGACLDVCEHDAREFVDDTEKFFEDLKKGEKISLLVAPAFKANYLAWCFYFERIQRKCVLNYYTIQQCS